MSSYQHTTPRQATSRPYSDGILSRGCDCAAWFTVRSFDSEPRLNLASRRGSGADTSVILLRTATPPVAAIGTNQLGSGGGINSVNPLAIAKAKIGAMKALTGINGMYVLNTW